MDRDENLNDNFIAPSDYRYKKFLKFSTAKLMDDLENLSGISSLITHTQVF